MKGGGKRVRGSWNLLYTNAEKEKLFSSPIAEHIGERGVKKKGRKKKDAL